MIFVVERVGETANQIEQASAAGRNTCAVLDISLRPEFLRRGIITLAEQCIKSFQKRAPCSVWVM
jgi:hypothetical protein